MTEGEGRPGFDACCCKIHAANGKKCPNCPIHPPTIDPHLKPRTTTHQTRDINTGGKL